MAPAKVSLSVLVGLVLPVLIFLPCQSRGGDVISQPLQAADDWAMYGAAADHTFANTATPPDALGLIWSLPGIGPLGGASAVEADGFVYIADFDRTPLPTGPQLLVYKVVEGNGSFLTGWSTLINVPESSLLADSVARGVPRSLAVSGSLVYVLFTAGNATANREVVVAIDVITSLPRWTFNGAETWNGTTPKGTRSAPVLGSGILVFASQDGNVYALNPTSGALVWWSPAAAPVQSVPAIVGDIVYVASGTHLQYFDVQGKADGNQSIPDTVGTGDLLFEVDVGAPVLSSPIVLGEYAYLDVAGDLWKVDRLLAGTPLWVQTTPHETNATPAVATNLIVTRRSDDRAYAYDATSGEIAWVRSGLRAPTNGADAAVADGRVFLSAWTGSTYDLVVLDAADGTVLFRNTTSGRLSMGAPVVAAGKVLVTEGISLRGFRGQPDLTPDKVVMSRGTASENFANANVTITVRNLGDEPVSGIRVRVYDGDPSGTGVLIGQSTLGTSAKPLAPSALTTFTTADRDWSVGPHDVWVVVDRALTEGDDANNARAFPIYVQPGPPRDPIVLGAGPYGLALLAGFAIGILVLWFPLQRLRELRRKEKEK